MNVKDMVLNLYKEYSQKFDMEPVGDIDELLLTVISKFQLFEPCRYLSEDEEWLNVAMISIENPEMSQAMSIRKDEITTMGIFNPDEIEIDLSPQKGSEDLYQ